MYFSLTQALSQTSMFYIFMGIMVFLALLSGIFVYHSIFMAHTQHGHDDEY